MHHCTPVRPESSCQKGEHVSLGHGAPLPTFSEGMGGLRLGIGVKYSMERLRGGYRASGGSSAPVAASRCRSSLLSLFVNRQHPVRSTQRSVSVQQRTHHVSCASKRSVASRAGLASAVPRRAARVQTRAPRLGVTAEVVTNENGEKVMQGSPQILSEGGRSATSSVMAVILGGGAGSRLYPLTKNRAKPAVPIGGPTGSSTCPCPIVSTLDCRRFTFSPSSTPRR